MPIYQFKGRRKGALEHGEMEAASPHAAANALVQQGITPLEIVEGSLPVSGEITLFQSPPNIEELILFSRQMYSLNKAGVPILRSLNSLAESTRHPMMVAALKDLGDQLQNGRSLGDAMARHPRIFSSLYVNIVRVGDNTGQLDASFLQLAEHLLLEKQTADRIKSATRYPMIVIGAIAIAIGIINVFVIPAFAGIFAKAKVDLPWATQLLMATSKFFVAWWPHMLVGIIGGIIWLRYWVSTEVGRRFWDRVKFSLPIVGSIIMRATLARFARSFAITFKAGMPLVQILTVVSHAVDNHYLGEKIRGMRDGVERGDSLSRTAARARIFTPVALQMLSVGEEIGNMDEMMQEVADFYEREVDYDLKTLSQAIEPILTGAVAVLVLILALGVFLPMWDMGSTMLKKH